MTTKPILCAVLASLATLSISSAVLGDEDADKTGADEPATVLTVGRYLGFRAATDVTAESDYNFTLFADGAWRYKPLVGGDEERGELGDKLAAWKKKLAKTGLEKLKEPKGPLLVVEDAPQVTIVSSEGGKERTFKLSPDDKTATALHDLIQKLREGAKKADAKME